MLGERNVVYVVIYRIRILRIFRKLRKLRILKILKFLNILTYILIAFNTITIRITDTFSVDYADSPCRLIALSPYFYGLLPTCLQTSSSASVEVRRKHSYISRRDTEPLPKERFNTSIDTSKKNNNIKTHPANPMTCRVKIFRFYTNSIDMPWITIRIVSASMNRSYSRLLMENLMFLEIHPSSLRVLTKHVPCP